VTLSSVTPHRIFDWTLTGNSLSILGLSDRASIIAVIVIVFSFFLAFALSASS
jgi:hypothetical protein